MFCRPKTLTMVTIFFGRDKEPKIRLSLAFDFFEDLLSC